MLVSYNKFLENLEKAKTPKAAWKILASLAKDQGFSVVNYGYGDTRNIFTGDFRWFTPFSNDWADHYKEMGYGEFDYINAHCMKSRAIILTGADNIPKNLKNYKENFSLFSDAAEVGFKRGFAFSILSPDGLNFGMFHFGGDLGEKEFQEIFQKSGFFLHAAAFQTHIQICSLQEGFRSPPVRDVKLTNQQRVTLSYMGEGLSQKEIAFKMNISVRTVRHHIDQLKQNLGVTTRREVFPMAVKLRLLKF
ncbi:MAG: autoinducer binding domain-containing protein [Sphingomonadales bacterium]